MAMIQVRFFKLKDPDQVIVLQDLKSAQLLAGILGRWEPGKWVLEEGVTLGSRAEPDSPQKDQLPSLPLVPLASRGGGMEISKRPDQRRFERFNLDFNVTLICQGHRFKTSSENISLGGMALKHKVPFFMLNQSCRIQISRRDSLEVIELQCRMIGQGEDPRRVKFVSPDSRVIEALQSWIDRHSSSASRRDARRVA